MAGGGVRLLAVLRPRRGTSGAGDVDEPELLAIGRGWAREESAGLGIAPRAAVSRIEIVVVDTRTRGCRLAGAPSQRPGKCEMVCRKSRCGSPLASPGAGALANHFCATRAAGACGRCA